MLEHTLAQLHAFGLSDLPVIVCDDGSIPRVESACLRRFPNSILIRNESPSGQALARNQIAQVCKTPYLLQLDDDSYPVSGDIQALLTCAESRSKWIALALPFEEPARGRVFNLQSAKSEAIQVKSFVGCSVLLNVDAFREVGGYADWIGRTVEEEELCLRSLACGFSVLQVDILRIRHEVTDANRNTAAITRRSFRNWFLLWWIHAPGIYRYWRLAMLLAAAVIMTLRQRSLAAVLGLFEATKMFKSLTNRQAPVSVACYRKFRLLPHALDFFTR